MPHYKCDACKIRLHSSGARIDPSSDVCPECGAVLGPVADLTLLVGSRLIAPPRRTDPADAATNWLDGEPRAAAVALPPPQIHT